MRSTTNHDSFLLQPTSDLLRFCLVLCSFVYFSSLVSIDFQFCVLVESSVGLTTLFVGGINIGGFSPKLGVLQHCRI